MAVTAVPDTPEATVPGRQLPLFESHRPQRFQLVLGGNVELSLANEAEAAMAEALKLGKGFIVRIASDKDEDLFLEFEATVTKRAHTRVRHSEQGDSVVSSARLAIVSLDADED